MIDKIVALEDGLVKWHSEFDPSENGTKLAIATQRRLLRRRFSQPEDLNVHQPSQAQVWLVSDRLWR